MELKVYLQYFYKNENFIRNKYSVDLGDDDTIIE